MCCIYFQWLFCQVYFQTVAPLFSIQAVGHRRDSETENPIRLRERWCIYHIECILFWALNHSILADRVTYCLSKKNSLSSKKWIMSKRHGVKRCNADSDHKGAHVFNSNSDLQFFFSSLGWESPGFNHKPTFWHVFKVIKLAAIRAWTHLYLNLTNIRLKAIFKVKHLFHNNKTKQTYIHTHH